MREVHDMLVMHGQVPWTYRALATVIYDTSDPTPAQREAVARASRRLARDGVVQLTRVKEHITRRRGGRTETVTYEEGAVLSRSHIDIEALLRNREEALQDFGARDEQAREAGVPEHERHEFRLSVLANHNAFLKVVVDYLGEIEPEQARRLAALDHALLKAILEDLHKAAPEQARQLAKRLGIPHRP